MKKLADLGVDKNTIIFFFSDNGGLSTAEGWPTSNLPLRAGKGWLYEGGIREPTIIKWPGVTPPGSVCDTPVISDDFYPTFLHMAGVGLRPKQHMDGTSLVPLLRRESGWRRDTLSWHYPHYSNQGGAPAGAISQGDWKLIEYFEDGRLELHNLRDDLGEQKDLATAMPEKARELQTMLAEWRRSVGAQMPGRRPESKPKESENG
jgi:arylsulfatase A-like enzyme